ncbi:hypothetical protein BGZ76_005915 [Entomortierella beljakovae]|nr:hypothetical protein BGZ76_005915 [Entomortierella beljakovae]
MWYIREDFDFFPDNTDDIEDLNSVGSETGGEVENIGSIDDDLDGDQDWIEEMEVIEDQIDFEGEVTFTEKANCVPSEATNDVKHNEYTPLPVLEEQIDENEDAEPEFERKQRPESDAAEESTEKDRDHAMALISELSEG